MARRLENIPGFSIDRVAAGSDPEALRLENPGADLPPSRRRNRGYAIRSGPR
ncbi:MAG TPA: hypothetical protein VNO70_21920 [Blastocatellia bacterium]|nr:hypothetical protein [Blastocatellia bacterium]